MITITSRALVLLFLLRRTFSRVSFSVVSCPIDQRATMGCPDSTFKLARPNSRTSSTSLVMTRANHHSLNHVAAAPIACCCIWDTSAIVRLTFPFFIGHAGVADRFTAFFLFIFFLLCVVNSIVLLTNGISFVIQAVLLLMIGARADYGTWRCARVM